VPRIRPIELSSSVATALGKDGVPLVPSKKFALILRGATPVPKVSILSINIKY
jgi:hypothetical protein